MLKMIFLFSAGKFSLLARLLNVIDVQLFIITHASGSVQGGSQLLTEA